MQGERRRERRCSRGMEGKNSMVQEVTHPRQGRLWTKNPSACMWSRWFENPFRSGIAFRFFDPACMTSGPSCSSNSRPFAPGRTSAMWPGLAGSGFRTAATTSFPAEAASCAATALSVTGQFKVYHPRSNQIVPPRGVGFLGLVGCSWQGLVGCFSGGMQQRHAPAVPPRGGVRGTVVPRFIRVARRRFSPSLTGLPGAGFVRRLPP